MANVGKRTTAIREGIDRKKLYELGEAIKLVKERANNRDGAFDEAESASARAAVRIALDVLLRLFAPFLPYATEEVWSWWRSGSVHRASWPVTDGFAEPAREGDPEVLTVVGEALSGLRKSKSEAKVKQRTAVLSATVSAPAAQLEQLRAGLTGQVRQGMARAGAALERTGGRRAHSARSWMGDNAIHKLGGVLTTLADYRARRVDIDGCEYREGLSAVAVGGGVAGNVIPDEAALLVNFRYAPDRDEDAGSIVRLEDEKTLRAFFADLSAEPEAAPPAARRHP